MASKRIIIDFLIDKINTIEEGESSPFSSSPYTFLSTTKGKVRRGSGFIPDTTDDIEVWVSVPGEVYEYAHGVGQSHGVMDVSIILMSRADDPREEFDKVIQDIEHIIDSEVTHVEKDALGITTLEISEKIFTPIGVTEVGIVELKIELVRILT